MASWFSIKILSIGSLSGFDTEKNMMKRTHVCNLKIRIEETSLWIATTVIEENVKISKYQNIKIANNSSIKRGSRTCVELTGSKMSWMYQLLFFIFSLRYFVNHDLNSWLTILPECWSELFFLIEWRNFWKSLVNTYIFQEIREIDGKIKVL